MSKGKITDYDHFGRGIIKTEKVTFIPKVLIDEEVEYQLLTEKYNYNEAKLVKIIKKSDQRVNPKCPYFEMCGGCDLEHMTYENTLDYKKNKLQNILFKYANISTDLTIIPSVPDYFYRNKINLKIINEKIGYFMEKTNNLVEIKECVIAKQSINQLLKDYNLFNLKNANFTIRSNYNDELIIIIETKDKQNIEIDLLKNIHKIVGIIFNNQLIYGNCSFIEQIHGKLFTISYDSFFQINNYINDKMAEILNQFIKPNSKILDLYCGVGSLGIFCQEKAKEIYGIEVVPSAIKNALINSKMNKLSNSKYFLGSTDKIIDKINGNFDTIILDPPRKGLSSKDIDFIFQTNPNQIVYISCDSMTLARDLKKIKENYSINKIYLLDMFPYTYHLESMVLLNRK